MIKVFSIESPVKETEFFQLKPEAITERVYHGAIEAYSHKVENTARRAFPVIKDVFENQSNTFENIVVPFTDGIKTIQVVANLRTAYETHGREVSVTLEKAVILAMIDDEWKEHLREMDELKQSVQNAVYEQKDPLLIYKFESFELFKQMVSRVNKEIISFLYKGVLPNDNNTSVQQERSIPAPKQPQLQATRTEVGNNNSSNQSASGNGHQRDPQTQPERVKIQPVQVEDKPGRNDPCFCGSGKKYKACHGK